MNALPTSDNLQQTDSIARVENKPRRMEKAFWIVSLIILLSDALFIFVNYQATHEVLQQNLLTKGQQSETHFQLNLRKQGLHMQQFATYLANQPEVRDLFIAGYQAVKAEGGGAGGETAMRIRKRLYELVSPGWQKVIGSFQLRQLHFHLGPGDTSFLRVHKPNKYGDDLSSIRHTITHAIRENKATAGFESGRVYAGIRGVVPISNDVSGSTPAIGALEAGSSFSQMLKLLQIDTGAAYSVLLTSRYFHQTHWPEFAEKLKQDNPLVGDWYIEGSEDQAIVRAMLKDPLVLQALGKRAATVTHIGGTPFSVYSYPFRDYLRNVNQDEPAIGVVLTWHDATDALAAADNSLRNNLLLGIVGFLIIETLLFTAWTLARRQLQRVIDRQLAELGDINFELQKEVNLRMQSELQLTQNKEKLEILVNVRTQELRNTVDALEDQISQREHIKKQLLQERDQASVTLNSIADGVITTDNQGRVQYLNPAAQSLTGWVKENALNRHLSQVFPARDLEHGGANLDYNYFLNNGIDHFHSENTQLRRHDGTLVTVEHTISPIRDNDGVQRGLVLVFHDDTEARELATQLSYHASHDALTNLSNRRTIEGELANALASAKTLDLTHAFLYIDLDQFKVVNDTCGHVAGDELLRQIAKLFQRTVRHSDSLARLGGDEFGLLLVDCPMEKSQQIAEQLLAALANFRFVWKERSFRIGASIGIALIEDHCDSVESILSTADAACYLAKDKGRNRVQLYQPDDTEMMIRQGEMNWVSRLQQALSEDRLILYGQSIVPVTSNNGMKRHQEILVRMLDEQGKLIAPNAFIPAAERYGIMHEVDCWIIDRTLKLIGEIDSPLARDKSLSYSINLSGDSMAHPGILDFITERLSRYQIDPSRICFEVTETAAISNLTTAIDLMSKLKEAGCRFALDDFGSGLSSFGYLQALPVDYLKIDGAFVKDLENEPINQVMVEAINAVGHAMKLKTIAEFVESEATMKELQRIGVDYAQGFWLDKPQSLLET